MSPPLKTKTRKTLRAAAGRRANAVMPKSQRKVVRQPKTQTRADPRQALPPGRIVLVMQGGGALGAYQMGVYQALHEAGIEPEWVIGTSIGAINAALIAGNAPDQRLEKLRAFWELVEWRQPFSINHAMPGWMAGPASNLSTLALGVPGFFEPNPVSWLGLQAKVGVED